MEDVFTIKVKTKPDKRNVYPSEKRYSASTVAGLAWVHIALAGTSFVLACLAIVHPIGGGMVTHLTSKDAVISPVDPVEFLENITMSSLETHEDLQANVTNGVSHTADEYSCILVLAPSMLTVSSLAAGIASIMASSHWYIDRNITWLFLMSVLSSVVAVVAFIMVIAWIASMDGAILTRFYADKEPFDDFVLIPKDNIVERNGSHLVIENSTHMKGIKEHLITKRVLSINILIACFLEFLWSVLSLKISYKGMKTPYRDEDNDRKSGNHVEVVTKIKGNKKSRQPAPDLINNYPTNKIKHALNDTTYNYDSKPESSSEYRARMMSFINRCSTFDEQSNVDPSVSDLVIPEIRVENVDKSSRNTTMSWGDPRDLTVYNQNNLDLGRIIKEKIQKKEAENDAVAEASRSENASRQCTASYPQ